MPPPTLNSEEPLSDLSQWVGDVSPWWYVS